jgi:hypothetical protein
MISRVNAYVAQLSEDAIADAMTDATAVQKKIKLDFISRLTLEKSTKWPSFAAYDIEQVGLVQIDSLVVQAASNRSIWRPIHFPGGLYSLARYVDEPIQSPHTANRHDAGGGWVGCHGGDSGLDGLSRARRGRIRA